MFRLRLFIFCAITIALSAFVLYRLRNKPQPPSVSVVAGSWTNANRLLTFLPQGGYWIARVDTAGAIHPQECGRWAEESTGALMRTEWPAGSGLLTSQPDLHLAAWHGAAPDQIQVMHAVPGAAGSFSQESFSRSRQSQTLSAQNLGWLEKNCHLD